MWDMCDGMGGAALFADIIVYKQQIKCVNCSIYM
jgi:hypothetical protein